MKNTPASLTFSKPATLVCSGYWTQQNIQSLEKLTAQLALPQSGALAIQGKSLEGLDTTGALLLLSLQTFLEKRGFTLTLADFSQEHLNVLTLIKENDHTAPPEDLRKPGMLEEIGKKTIDGCYQGQRFLTFVGEITIWLLAWCRHPLRIRWNSVSSGIETTGFNALPIVGLLAFLVGVVLAYQMGNQLTTYGAGIYVVDLMGIAVLREFGPLMTSIIIAGRTGSAYTAQLGTMILNEEVDALRTLGLSPTELLVLPKVLALLITLPLLSVFADIFGIFGGMIMARGMLGIEFNDFLQRFASVITLRTFVVGMIKTPVFALIIGSIGCFQGFEVSGGAESVGRKTTTSVVQSIFMIIVADAAFSVLFSILDI